MIDTQLAVPVAAVQTASAKMLISVAWPESFAGPTVHFVRSAQAITAICGVDVTDAQWATEGPACIVCDEIEDVEWYRETGKYSGRDPSWFEGL